MLWNGGGSSWSLIEASNENAMNMKILKDKGSNSCEQFFVSFSCLDEIEYVSNL